MSETPGNRFDLPDDAAAFDAIVEEAIAEHPQDFGSTTSDAEALAAAEAARKAREGLV